MWLDVAATAPPAEAGPSPMFKLSSVFSKVDEWLNTSLGQHNDFTSHDDDDEHGV
jgi:hypothetical protein